MPNENEYTVAFPRNESSDREPSSPRLSSPSQPAPFPFRELREGSPDHPVVVRLGACLNGSAKQFANESAMTGRVLILDQAVDQPVELSIGGQVIALGRLVLTENKVAIEVTELISATRGLRRAS